MRKFGLIGYPLGHSFSKGYFSEKFEKEGLSDCIYENYPLEDIARLPQLIADEPELLGLNVTIPYKQQVIEFMDSLDEQAKEIEAVNTIKIVRSSNSFKLTGYNSDIFGFELPLLKELKQCHKSALILGTGGASKAVAYILKKNNIEYKFVSREPKYSDILNYSELSPKRIKSSKIIVNCSPLGMHPKEDICPDLPYEALTNEHILYDLIYNPQETLFLKYGKQKKAITINGLPMLYIQAEKSWEIWNS